MPNWHTFSRKCVKLAYNRKRLYCSRKKYARICQSHKWAPKIPIMDLDKAQGFEEHAGSVKVSTYSKYLSEIKIDQNA